MKKERSETGRPPAEDKESSLKKEDSQMVALNQSADSLERIADGLERLIDVLVPKAPPTVTPMLTPLEASKQMRLNVQTVMKWCRQRKMGVKSGSKWLIDPEEVERYLRGVLLNKGQKVVSQ